MTVIETKSGIYLLIFLDNGRPILKTHDDGSKAPYHPVSVVVDHNGIVYASMYDNASIWKIDPKYVKKRFISICI